MRIGHGWMAGTAARSRRWPRAAIAAVTLAVPSLVAVQEAGATAPTSVIPGTVTPADTTAGANSSSYSIVFTTSASGTLGSGGTITFTAPDGTGFQGCSGSCSYGLAVNNGHAATVSSAAVSKVAGPGQSTVSSTNNQVVLTLGTSSIAGNDTVTVTTTAVENPVKAASYHLAESTSADTNVAASPSYSITAAPPAAVVATGGDNQSTAASSNFPVALTATVVDAFGNAVPGSSPSLSGDKVRFTGPASGAGLTFGASTSESDVIGSSGQATSTVPTANATTGTYTVSATLVNSVGTAVGGVTGQSFTLQNLSPSAPPPPAHVTPGSVGLTNNVEAQTGNYTIPFQTSPSGALNNAATITFVAPNGTTFPACTTLCGNYAIGVSNSHNASISTVVVSAANGSTTNNKAVITLLVSTIAGGDTVTVTVTGVGNPTLATTQNQMAESTSADTGVALSPGYTTVHGAASKTVVISGDNQTAQVGSQFPAPLVAAVEDANGNGVPGIQVTFTINSAGSPAASATFANTFATETDTTGSDGRATTSLPTANQNPGGPYTVTTAVTSPGGVAPTTFNSLTNTAGQVTPAAVGLNDTSAGATNVTYTVDFTTSTNGACASPCNVTLVAPNGTTFPSQKTDYSAPGGVPSAVTVTPVKGPGASTVSSTPNQAVLTLGSLTGGKFVSITISPVGNPTAASSSYVMQESTTADNTVATTQIYAISPGAPATVTTAGGSPQSAAPGAAFAQPLRALVTDQHGNPVPNVAVTFSAPASGTGVATATFAACAGGNTTANQCAVNTGADGIATSSALTASSTAGGYTAHAAVTGLTPAAFSLTNGQVLTPLAITVTPNTAGSTATYTVPFVTPSGGAIPASGTCPGSPTATCQVTLVAPNGTALPASAASYQVAVSNNHAMTLSDVSLADVQGPGPATTSTTPNQAVLSFDASSVVGGDTITVTIAGVTNPTAASDSYTFAESTSSDPNAVGSPSYSIGAAPATTVSTVAGNPQSATVNTAYATPLEVQVLDTYGNPVPGEAVTFAVAAASASGTFAACPGSGSTSTSCVVTSDANGDATALTLTANATAGTFDVNVSATSSNGPITHGLPVFQLTNTAGGPASVTKTAGDSQAVTVGSAYPTPLQVTVLDHFSNPVSGYPVTFSAPASGASVTFAGPCSGNTCSVTTDSSGHATATAMTANTTAGPVSVAVNAGQLQTAPFSLTNNPGTASAMIAMAGTTPQSTTVGTPFGTPLGVRVTDSHGNPVSGVTVTFTSPASGPSGNFASGCNTGSTSTSCIETTQSNGTAVASTFTADGQAGTYTVTASASGLTSASFSLTNNPGAVAFSSAVGGDGQLTATGAPYASPLQIEVVDKFGNPLQGVPVAFSTPNTGPTATFASCPGGNPTPFECDVTTDASGIATSSTLTANSLEGYFQPLASVQGLPDVTFTLGNEHSGYWLAASDGGVFNLGGAPYYGSHGGSPLNKPIVAIAEADGGNGYYLVASDGGVFNYGPDAPYLGSTGGQHLNAPIVGIAVDPVSGGYWLAAADGGVFNFGGAPYYGSHGGSPLNKPIVGIAAAPNGGYYLVASDGGIFNYGPGATYYGSHGGAPLNQPIVGMAEDATGDGYYLVARDGGIFNYGPGATYYGSHGGAPLNQPVVGMSVDPLTGGYWLVARDGGIFNYPDAEPFYGSKGGTPLNAPVIGMAPSGW